MANWIVEIQGRHNTMHTLTHELCYVHAFHLIDNKEQQLNAICNERIDREIMKEKQMYKNKKNKLYAYWIEKLFCHILRIV